MSDILNTPTSRRQFTKRAGQIAAAGALVSTMGVPFVHAAANETIQLALVGCGGRGSGAALNALGAKNGPVKLVAMADVFPDRLNNTFKSLSGNRGAAAKIDVPEDRRFVGFDAYRKALDCLRPGDVAIFATPPAFRWVHFTYAIEKNLNVFMEKPVTVDGPTTRRMLKLGEEAAKKNLKVGVGLMCRHCRIRGELFNRIKDGQIGDIVLLQAYRMHGPVASFASGVRPANQQELHYQIRRFHSFIWASGGCYNDFYIHNIDESCWMKDAWPVAAQASGGRHYRGPYVDQNFDSYSVEYTFADGAKLMLNGRCMDNCHNQFASYALGTKGLAVISTDSHTPARSKIIKGYKMDGEVLWHGPDNEPNPYDTEWDDLLEAIRNDKPYNEVKRGAEASMVTSMGRMAAHTGQVFTYDMALNHKVELAPDVDKLTLDSPAPVQADAEGKYPVPNPGKGLGENRLKEYI